MIVRLTRPAALLLVPALALVSSDTFYSAHEESGPLVQASDELAACPTHTSGEVASDSESSEEVPDGGEEEGRGLRIGHSLYLGSRTTVGADDPTLPHRAVFPWDWKPDAPPRGGQVAIEVAFDGPFPRHAVDPNHRINAPPAVPFPS